MDRCVSMGTGGALYKSSGPVCSSSGIDAWRNAGAISKHEIWESSAGYSAAPQGVVYSVDASSRAIVGLANGDSHQGYDDIEFGLLCDCNSSTLNATVLSCDQQQLFVYESGTNKGEIGTCGAGDRLEVHVVGSSISYVKNGKVLSVSDAPATLPLNVDTSIYAGGITNVVVYTMVALQDGIDWVNLVGVTVTNNSITKNSDEYQWNAGAISTRELHHNEYVPQGVLFKCPNTSVELFAGLADAGHIRYDGTSHSPNVIAHALFCSRGSLWVVENGMFPTHHTVGTYVASDELEVRVIGDSVTYVKNTNTLHTSTITPTFPLVVDVSLKDKGDSVQDLTFMTAATALAIHPTPSPTPACVPGRYAANGGPVNGAPTAYPTHPLTVLIPVEGEANTGHCPAGANPITVIEDCQAAALQMVHDFTSQYVFSAPAGCYKMANAAQVFFNFALAGSMGQNHVPLCMNTQEEISQINFVCQDCLRGTVSSIYNAPACDSCPSGKYQKPADFTVCSACPHAQWTEASTSGRTECVWIPTPYPTPYPTPFPTPACTPGSRLSDGSDYGSDYGSYGSYGSFSSFAPATWCIDCPAGQYSAAYNIVVCTDCPSGQFSQQAKSGQCTSCATTSWTVGLSAQTECVAVPTESPTLSLSASPTAAPTASPTTSPTPSPTMPPTPSPTASGGALPTAVPSLSTQYRKLKFGFTVNGSLARFNEEKVRLALSSSIRKSLAEYHVHNSGYSIDRVDLSGYPKIEITISTSDISTNSAVLDFLASADVAARRIKIHARDEGVSFEAIGNVKALVSSSPASVAPMPVPPAPGPVPEQSTKTTTLLDIFATIGTILTFLLGWLGYYKKCKGGGEKAAEGLQPENSRKELEEEKRAADSLGTGCLDVILRQPEGCQMFDNPQGCQMFDNPLHAARTVVPAPQQDENRYTRQDEYVSRLQSV
jgi:hypothetical protein